MKRRTLAMAILTITAMLAMAPSARAVDGTTGINQARVLAAGGFPYTISASGSYRLTGNLTVSATNVPAIQITANYVTVDLNGFSIIGPGGAATQNGIQAPTASNVEVKNGSITGFAWGVYVGDDSIVKSVTANSNLALGIEVGANSVIDNCTTNSDGNNGIVCSASGCTLSGNTANGNVYGIVCSTGDCTIFGNLANSNSNSGIACNSGGGCTVINNTVDNNTTNGLFFSTSTSGFGGNVLDGNGTSASGGISMMNNACSGVLC